MGGIRAVNHVGHCGGVYSAVTVYIGVMCM